MIKIIGRWLLIACCVTLLAACTKQDHYDFQHRLNDSLPWVQHNVTVTYKNNMVQIVDEYNNRVDVGSTCAIVDDMNWTCGRFKMVRGELYFLCEIWCVSFAGPLPRSK